VPKVLDSGTFFTKTDIFCHFAHYAIDVLFSPVIGFRHSKTSRKSDRRAREARIDVVRHAGVSVFRIRMRIFNENSSPRSRIGELDV